VTVSVKSLTQCRYEGTIGTIFAVSSWYFPAISTILTPFAVYRLQAASMLHSVVNLRWTPSCLALLLLAPIVIARVHL